jgi:hypothetical protein
VASQETETKQHRKTPSLTVPIPRIWAANTLTYSSLGHSYLQKISWPLLAWIGCASSPQHRILTWSSRNAELALPWECGGILGKCFPSLAQLSFKTLWRYLQDNQWEGLPEFTVIREPTSPGCDELQG